MPTTDDGGRMGASRTKPRKRARKSRFASASSNHINTHFDSLPSHPYHPNQLTVQKRPGADIVQDAHKRYPFYSGHVSSNGNALDNGSSKGHLASACVNPYVSSLGETLPQTADPYAIVPRSIQPLQTANPYACTPPPPPPEKFVRYPLFPNNNDNGQVQVGGASCCPPSAFVRATDCGESDGRISGGVTVFLSEVPAEFCGGGAAEILDGLFSGAFQVSAPPTVRVNRSRGGKCLAWITFGRSSEAKVAIRVAKSRGLRARIHKESSSGSAKGYERRAAAVLSNGGLANTLLLRNAPAALTERELRALLSLLPTPVPVLRIRTASLGMKRAFWLVYASQHLCKLAHTAMSRNNNHQLPLVWTLRCGETYRPNPILHDDSADADAKKRRSAMRKLGSQKSAGDLCKDAGIVQAPAKPAARALEHFLLRNDKHLCMFMKE